MAECIRWSLQARAFGFQQCYHSRRLKRLAYAMRLLAVGATDGNDLLAWGSGKNGRLGTGSSNEARQPVRVEDVEGGQILDLRCGLDFTLVLTS